jgi:hypothetical protein
VPARTASSIPLAQRAVGQRHEAELLVGRADRGEHSQLAHAAVRDDDEAGRGDQRDEQQPDGRHHEHADRGDDTLVAGARADVDAGAARDPEVAGLIGAGVDEDRHVVCLAGL